VAVSSATSVIAERNKSAFVRWIPGAAFVAAFAISLLAQRNFLFEIDPADVPRAVYGMQPFPEALKVAEYLRSHSDPAAPIAVLGSEPEIYFYAHRHSATGYIYTYALMEEQPYALTMQQEFISEIEATRPEFIVLVNVPTSWLDQPESHRNVFTWMQRYIPDHYEPVGVADIQSDEHTEYRWGEEASQYQTRSQVAVWVLRRKD
jgi:hypothetical protein